jgi:hypothetical protein
MAGDRGPASSLLHPLRDQGLVGTGLEAETGGGHGPRLAVTSLVEPSHEPRHLGQQRWPVVAARNDFLQLSDSGGCLGFRGVAPAGVPLTHTGQFGHGQAGRVRSRTILSHPARFEHENDKSKLSEPLACDD